MLDLRGLEAAAKATFAKANEGNLKPETIESLWPSQHLPHWSGLAEAAITAYLQAVGPEPAVAGVETCKFYHSQWPVEDRLKARGPYGLITDDGEAWRYEYTHSDADGGPYDVVCRPRSALVATPPAVPVVEDIRKAVSTTMMRHIGPDGWTIGRGGCPRINWHQLCNELVAALATKPAVKDDETVITDAMVKAALAFAGMRTTYENREGMRAALAAKDGRP